MAFELARQGAAVTALEADPSMLAAARLRAENEANRVQLVEGNADSLPFDDATGGDRALLFSRRGARDDGNRPRAQARRTACRRRTRTLEPLGRATAHAGLVTIGPVIDRFPVLITQHMPPTFTRILAEHLARSSHRAHFADGEQRFHAMVSRHFARS